MRRQILAFAVHICHEDRFSLETSNINEFTVSIKLCQCNLYPNYILLFGSAIVKKNYHIYANDENQNSKVCIGFVHLTVSKYFVGEQWNFCHTARLGRNGLGFTVLTFGILSLCRLPFLCVRTKYQKIM